MLPQSDDQARKPSQEDAAPNPPEQPASAPEADPDLKSPRGHPFPIVGIGASAGGLEAITALLHALPGDTGMAYVVVQHLDPDHKSQLSELLAAATPMPVHTVEDRMLIQANQVYVIPPNATMILEDGSLRLAERTRGLHLPIDAFFESLARVQGSGAIGIVLSGNASDGSHGIRDIKDKGGITFAQDEASAGHIGMPRNAAATGAVDFVLPPADIAEELLRIAKHPYVAPPAEAPEEEVLPEGDGELKRIFKLLQNHTKIDFSNYKQLPLRRRLGRRMLVLRLNELSDYRRYVEEHPSELKQLYGDLLIGVTSFFRDPEAFDAVKQL
jgi:two-component system CheB/CheR fusion protein